jgi:hypothetical protein
MPSSSCRGQSELDGGASQGCEGSGHGSSRGCGSVEVKRCCLRLRGECAQTTVVIRLNLEPLAAASTYYCRDPA